LFPHQPCFGFRAVIRCPPTRVELFRLPRERQRADLGVALVLLVQSAMTC